MPHVGVTRRRADRDSLLPDPTLGRDSLSWPRLLTRRDGCDGLIWPHMTLTDGVVITKGAGEVRSRVELFAEIRRDARVEERSVRELADRYRMHGHRVRYTPLPRNS